MYVSILYISTHLSDYNNKKNPNPDAKHPRKLYHSRRGLTSRLSDWFWRL